MNILKEATKRGFTLLEVAIAIVLSAIILLGLYSMTDGLVRTKGSLDSANVELMLVNEIELLMSRDVRMQTGTGTNDNRSRDRDYLFTIKTNNSLVFNKARPVTVSYFVDKVNDKLYREELEKDMDFIMLLPLIDNVTEPYVETFNGSAYREGFNNSGYIFRVWFTLNNRRMSFIIGKASKVSN